MELLRKTKSICPKCLRSINAEIVDDNGKVLIKKNCKEHGNFEDLYWSDTEHYKWMMKFQDDGSGVKNPKTKRVRGCPYDCGLCDEHKSHTMLGIIDVTNRCNLKCPVCFANSDALGYLYQPTKEQVVEMMTNLLNNKPVATKALQFSGGEPTMRDDLPELVKTAKGLGFKHVEVDTNGVRIANEPEYAKKLADAGTNLIYLQFDGLDDGVYRKTRGVPLMETKLKAIENWKKTGRWVVFVVTLAKGVNDHQIGEIIRFAIKNKDVVRGVNFQPISFSGRASRMEVKKKRITTDQFIKLVEKQTNGSIRVRDFYPVPSIVPVSRFVGAYLEKPKPEATTHPLCGVGTYIMIDENGSYIPITELIDVERFMDILKKATRELVNEGVISKKLRLGKVRVGAKLLKEIALEIKNPKIRRLIIKALKDGCYEALRPFHYNSIMIGCMHFMDAWNFDLDRVQRCVIHYALPNGKIIPFCSYNSIHRENIEREFAVPIKN